ncbi:hypothetical protein ACODM8_21220, partial [Vibrio ostreicida]|uniref:hypothetical protein n=1 Tax=Vibrio ostreicida TaxID=526588 RepID=UPI003B5B572D
MKHYNYLALCASIFLSACGGGGGDGDDKSPPARKVGSISGYVYDAPVVGATVTAWEYDNGKIGRHLGVTKTDQHGHYSIPVTSGPRPILITSNGGRYQDPFTRSDIQFVDGFSLSFKSAINYQEGSNATVMVTPLTNISVGLTEYKIKNNINNTSDAITSSNDAVKELYGFDVIETKPVDFVSGGPTRVVTPGHEYGMLLTAYSSFASEFPQDEHNRHSSANLANIQYEDIKADGKLDGVGLTEDNTTKRLGFGHMDLKEIPMTQLYTHELAKHIIISANNSEVNLVGLPPDQLAPFSGKVNVLDSPILTGTGVPLDEKPPTVSRDSEQKLYGMDMVALTLRDDVGIDNVGISISYQPAGQSVQQFSCDLDNNESPEFCSLNRTQFTQGKREATIGVRVNTFALDSVSGADLGQAKLIVEAEDTLENKGSKDIEFKWDNSEPQVNILSQDSVQDGEDTYTLRFSVDYLEKIKSAEITFNGGAPTIVDLTCGQNSETKVYTCDYNKAYQTKDIFSANVAEIVVTATSSVGAKGSDIKTVTRDNNPPKLDVSGSGVEFLFIDNGEKGSNPKGWLPTTYTADTVQDDPTSLWVDYIAGIEGLRAFSGNFGDFSAVLADDFIEKDTNTNTILRQVPYLIAEVEDTGTPKSTPDKINLIVKHSVFRNGAFSDPHVVNAIEGNAVNIPRKKYQEKETSAYYYIPLSDDILNGVEQNVPNKLEITAIDQATNPSPTKTVFFKMSYDLPEVKVVTPYAGAKVQVKDLISGSKIGSCTTKKELNAAGDEALNVASCRAELRGDMASVFSVSLSGSATYYYNPEVYGQSNEAPTEITVDLGDKDFTVYFSPEATQTFYINELTVFHSALFESLWKDGQNGTLEKAKEILALVQEALQGTDSFFGFDPTRTAYETIEEAQAIRDTNGDSVLTSLSPSQKHRLLAESLAFINGEPSEVNTSTSIARKIYEDLKDGKAHGLPTHGAATYQIIWAQKFQERMVNPQSGSYFVSAPIALQIADQLALAFPKLGETPIFEQQGSSIDQSGPSHNLTITTGKQYQKGANTYIAGLVDVSLTIEDPSGVKASSVQPKWVSLGDDNEKDASIIVNDPTGGTYKKSYNFSLDSTLDQYKNIEKFLLHISAEDFKGYPLDNYIETLVVDNDVPVVTYHLKDSTGANWDTSLEDVFVNPSQFFSLDFSVSDAVGDQPSKRRVSLEHTETRVYAFVDPKMLLNKDASFAIGLCGSKEGEGCNSRPTEREHNFYLQGDGEWNINVEATDYLENGQTKQVGKILLDTTPPIVNSLLNGGKALSTTEKNWLSGDEMLQPSINWQGDKGVTPFSAGERVSVSLNLQGSGTKDLVSCALLDSADEKPCLIGDQPNVKVKLVARAFTQHDTPSTLYISATDKAKPANTSEKTQINVYFDRKGPVLDLQEPWLEDTHVNRSTYVLGKTFHVKLKNIADDSLSNDTPITLELYQYQVEDIDGNKPNDILIKRVSRSNLVDAITVTEIESEKIIPVGDIPSATFYIKATDVEGNYTLSHIASHGSNGTKVLFDKEGPEINLSGYDSMAYYKGDYQFTVNAQDYISLEGNKGAAGIDDDSLTYWLFEEGSSKSGTGTPIVDKRISLNSLTDGVLNLTMTGSDIRGNRHEVTKKINVRNSLPSIELVSIAYADGTDVERPQGNSQHLVTKQGNLEVKIKVEDKSGIDALKGTLLNGENTQIGTLTLKEVEGESNLWAATVDQGVISSDGHYLIKFTASNRVKVNSLGVKEKTETTYPFSVARSGPKLSIVEPIDFATHTSNHNLSVKLALDGTVVPSQMRCWVRNNYTSDIEPRGDEANKNASSLLTNNYQDCEIKSIDTNMDNPSFILWTKGSNGAESVQKWSFKQVDIEAPEYCRTFENNRCVTGSDFNLKNQHVFYDKQSKAKQLKFDLFFSDNLSGILTDDTDDTRFPRLESLNKTITPTSCKKVANQTDENRISCEFGGPYADFIDINNIDQVFKVGNLADLAGNGTDLTIEFKTPDATDGIGVELNVPKYVSGESLVVVYKVKSYAGSKIDDVKVEVDNVTYSRREKPTMFGQAKTCTDDPEKLCQTFTIDTPQNKEGQVVPIKVVVTDFWGESGVSTVESVTIDTTEPTIGDVLTNLTHDNNGKVRLEFAIEDSGSQLSKVKYTAFDQDTEVVKVPFNVLEIPVETLTNTTTMTVKVQAFDDAGNTFIQNVKVNLSVPKIELLLDGISGLNEQKIAIKKSAQAFTLKNTQTASDVTAAKYKIILDSVTPDSQILKEGRFSSQDEKDELTLDLDAQGSYKLRIEVMDSIGRTSDNFTFSGKAFSTEGVLTVVDFLDPVVNNLRIDVSEKPQSNQYEVTVLAEIKDVNFDAATVTLMSTDGPFSKSYPMVKVGTDQDYQLKLQLPVGGYKATVKVVDLVGRETITPATQFEVDEAEAPTVSSIMTESGKRTLGGGVKARFKIVFNEAVQEFVQQDITVTVNDGGDVGSLTQLQTTDRKTWLFDYTTPTDTDKSVRFTIAAGMVKNEVTGVEGPVVAFSEEFAVKNSAPSPTLVELSSELVNTNEQITFNVTFAEKTTMPSTSYLGDSTNKILWETQDSAKKWTGTAIAKATSEDLALAVVISGYRDEFGNEGEVYSEKKILLRPSITINQLEINAGRITFNGNAGRVGDTATVTLS